MKKKNLPINNKINAETVVLIDDKGNKKGEISISEALKYAENKSLDLVQVSPLNAHPVVCKVLDHGKFLFEKKKVSPIQEQRLKSLL